MNGKREKNREESHDLVSAMSKPYEEMILFQYLNRFSERENDIVDKQVNGKILWLAENSISKGIESSLNLARIQTIEWLLKCCYIIIILLSEITK